MIRIWFLLTIGIFALLAVPVSSFYLRRKQYQQMDWMYFSKKSKRDSTLYAFYAFFADWSLTRHFIDKLKRQVDKYYPGRDKEAAAKTMKIFFFEMGTALLAVLLILVLRLGIIASVGLLALVFFINVGHVHKANENLDRFFLEDLKAILIKIRHAYQSSGTVRDALESTFYADVPESMKVHLKYLISVLEEDDMEESIKRYMDNVPNGYMKEYMALCATIEEFGDTKVQKDRSQFLTRLSSLWMRIDNELRIRKQRKHQFYGFLLIIALPIYTIPLIRSWAAGAMPFLEKYYAGSYGIWVSIASFILVVTVFQITIRLQESFHLLEKDHVLLFHICELRGVHTWLKRVLEKNEGRRRRLQTLLANAAETMSAEQLFLKQLLFAGGVFLLANGVFLGIHINQRNYEINHLQELGQLSSVISQEEEDELRAKIGILLQTYAGEKVTDALIADIRRAISTDSSEYVVDAAVEEVTLRLNQYNEEYYRWYELLISIVLSVSGFFYPYGKVLYESRVVKTGMLTEVMQLQSVLSILVPIPQMTPEIMLSWMEHFAVIFQPVVRRCMDSLASEEAMEELLESVTFLPMKRILENLYAADNCGIPAAFDELEAEHNSHQEDQKQEEVLQLDDKSAIGRYMAIVPFIFVFILYLFVPFTIETTKMFLTQV